MTRINLRVTAWQLVSVLLLLADNPSNARTFASVPVDIQVPVTPVVFKAGGKFHFLYELHITSFRAKNLELTRLEILDQNGAAIKDGTYSGDELNALIGIPGAPDSPNKRVIGAGLRAIVFLGFTAESEKALPHTLRHRLSFKQDDPNKPSERVVEGGTVTVREVKPFVIAPPVRGEGWLALQAPENTGSHRRTVVAVDGEAHIAQRFAIDWSRLDAQGQAFHGDPANNANWTPYGAEVLAVSDGTVVDLNDGVPENDPTSDKKAVPITLDTVGGNYLILDIGEGHFAFYAHLQPKSLRVKVGEKVRRGQVLALLGNSGQADAPHLHFHITDNNSPLGAEGIPYVFESFDEIGVIPSLKVLTNGQGWKPVPGVNPVSRKLEMPVKDAVIRFP